MKRDKKIFFVLLTPLLLISSYLGISQTFRFEGDKDARGNLWIKTGYKDFSQGELDGTVVARSGSGEVTLENQGGYYKSKGIYTSPEIATAPFEHMVLSWNADTPEGTWIKLEAQVLVKKESERKWSKWLSWGTWSTSLDRASENSAEEAEDLAKLSTDTLTVKGSEGEVATAVRYRLTLYTVNPSSTPSVRLVAGALRNTLSGQAIPSLYNEEEKALNLSNLDKELEVPSYSQYLRDPEIAHFICSPTSITSIMNYHGAKLLPEEAAWGVYDSVYKGFGNWSFSTAYAASHGFTAYVKYCESVDDLKREIYAGYPVAVSLRYKNSEDVAGNLPVIHGAPIAKTPGHLIVVRGFTFDKGREYIIVNDSAAATDEGARLKYPIDEFDRAWQTSGRTAYIIHEGSGVKSAPQREAAQLKEIKTASKQSQSPREFELFSGNRSIDLTSENVKTIMISRAGEKYKYVIPGSNKTLFIDKSWKSGRYEFLIIAKGNRIYTGEFLIE